MGRRARQFQTRPRVAHRRRTGRFLHPPHRATPHGRSQPGLGEIVKRVAYPAPIQALIAELKRMPGIGPRSAERIALWMVQSKDARPRDIAASIEATAGQIHPCPKCAFFTADPLCEFCGDTTRDSSLLCVVEHATDILPIE